MLSISRRPNSRFAQFDRAPRGQKSHSHAWNMSPVSNGTGLDGNGPELDQLWSTYEAVYSRCFFLILVAAPMRAQPVDIGPPIGRLVKVNGRNLHFNCTGRGSPTVILEAGASSFALDWALVQPEIARSQRVCSYDRAGSGWSDPRPDVETPARVVDDLQAGLSAAGEKPPFVLVGASMGGIYVRLFQLDHPKDVVGLVFVDPATEERLFTMYQGQAVAIASLTSEQLLTTLPKGGSVRVPRRSPQSGSPFDRLPPELYQLRLKLDQRLIDSTPSPITAEFFRESSEGQRAALARLRNGRTIPHNPMRDLPVVVLTRGQDVGEGLVQTHANLAELSGNARHETVQNAGHEIHLFAPSVVAQSIRDVCVAVREGGNLPTKR